MKKCLLILGFLFLLSGCGLSNVVSGPTETVTESIALEEKINEGLIELHFGVGSLHFNGSSEAFVQGKFTSNDKRLIPSLDYNTKRDKGTLLIKPKKSKLTGKVNNEWELAFTDQIPLAFELNLGVGENHLKFDNLNLKELTVNAGVGDTFIDLANVISNDFAVNISSGVGRIKLGFSSEQAVIVDVNKGIGSVSTEGFVVANGRYTTIVESKNAIKVVISQGIGEIVLEAR